MAVLQKISRNVVARNLVLALCALIVFTGVCALLLNVFTRHGQQRPVPDFTGVHISEVERTARREGLRVEVIDSMYAPTFAGGAVIEQLPAGGTEVKKGRRVLVTVASEQQKMVGVACVTGYSLRQAKNMIEMAGLEIKELRYVPNIATGNVLAELAGRDTVRRASNLQLEAGSGVTLVVGQAEGAAWVQVPKVAGLTLAEAKSRLWERGFNVGDVARDEGINPVNQRDAQVYRQSLAPGRTAALGTRVSISLTLDEKKINDGSARADRDARAAAESAETTEE